MSPPIPDAWTGSPAEAEAAGDPTGPEQHDPDAPYGYRLDGTPKTSARGRPRKATSGARTTGGTRTRTKGPASVPGPPRARQSSSKAKPKGKDYKAGVDGILQLLAVPLLFSYPDDATALVVYGEPLSQAIDDLAHDDPRFAAVLDRVLAAGPYGALLAAAMGLGSQLAVNHGVIPADVGKFMGAMPVDQLRAMVQWGPPAGAQPAPAPAPAPAAGASSAAA